MQPNHVFQKADSIAKVQELIRGIKVAMLTSVSTNGNLHSRPMASLEGEFDGHLWFFTCDNSQKTVEVKQDENVNLAYANEANGRYLSLAGTARVVRDHAKMEELWVPSLGSWFSKGIDDPLLVLLHVTVHEAEFWDSSASGVVKLVGFAKSVLTGKSAGPTQEHGYVAFS